MATAFVSVLHLIIAWLGVYPECEISWPSLRALLLRCRKWPYLGRDDVSLRINSNIEGQKWWIVRRRMRETSSLLGR